MTIPHPEPSTKSGACEVSSYNLRQPRQKFFRYSHWWSTWFLQKNRNLSPGNYNQFEVDDAKSKLQFMASWNWRSGAGKQISYQAYFEQKIFCRS